jgi:hypothetical protein
MIRDSESVAAVSEMFDGQGATDLFDQSPKQHEEIAFRITGNPELVAYGNATAKLERIDGNSCPEKMRTEVKFVGFSGAVSDDYRLELEIFEFFKAA